MNKKHLKCWLWKVLWVLGVASLVIASIIDTGTFLGQDAQYWYWTALVLGVLAIPIKMDCRSCGVCYVPPQA